jgi:RNA polymerase sigma-70 factor (ECF subfamily)
MQPCLATTAERYTLCSAGFLTRGFHPGEPTRIQRLEARTRARWSTSSMSGREDMSTATLNRPPVAVAADDPDAELVAGLRGRDEGAYLALVRRYTPLMLRVARGYLAPEIAEDVVQDTWVAVLEHIDSFQGRSSFKTWLFRILVNMARTHRLRESRTVCWSSLPGEAPVWDAAADTRACTDPMSPERRALAGEVWSALGSALDTLPRRQRAVLVLRDVEGWTSGEVREVLLLSAGNQRVLLHRARSTLREALEPYASERGSV